MAPCKVVAFLAASMVAQRFCFRSEEKPINDLRRMKSQGGLTGVSSGAENPRPPTGLPRTSSMSRSSSSSRTGNGVPGTKKTQTTDAALSRADDMLRRAAKAKDPGAPKQERKTKHDDRQTVRAEKNQIVNALKSKFLSDESVGDIEGVKVFYMLEGGFQEGLPETELDLKLFEVKGFIREKTPLAEWSLMVDDDFVKGASDASTRTTWAIPIKREGVKGALPTGQPSKKIIDRLDVDALKVSDKLILVDMKLTCSTLKISKKGFHETTLPITDA